MATLAEWRAKVSSLVRDSGGIDLSASQVDETGIRPALAQYGIDRPRHEVVELAGAGSAYLSLPAAWVEGWSTLEAVEYPARQTPPVMLDPQSWIVTRDPLLVAVTRILLLGATPTVGQHVRLTFTAPWPFPAAIATDDLVDGQAYEAVSALAAARCCDALAGEASRSRSGALPTDFAGGENRALRLIDAAKRYQQVYDRFLGFASADAAASPVGPASRRLDFDPAHGSVFHGGRR